MTEDEFKRRTKQLGLRVIKLVDELPRKRSADVIGRQVLRSGTSVGANYRAACRAQSPKDMIGKLRIVEEEADESVFWLELICESGLMPEKRLKSLLQESGEILAMTVASIKTLQRKVNNQRLTPSQTRANRKSAIENPK